METWMHYKYKFTPAYEVLLEPLEQLLAVHLGHIADMGTAALAHSRDKTAHAFILDEIPWAEEIVRSTLKWKNCWTKRKLESLEVCVRSPVRHLKLYGCAAILSRFLVAQLLHYLIGKKGFRSSPGFHFTLKHTVKYFHAVTHSEWGCGIVCVFFTARPSLWGRHSSFFGTWNSLAGGTGSVIVRDCLLLMFSALHHTLYIFPIFSLVMFNPSPMSSIPVSLSSLDGHDLLPWLTSTLAWRLKMLVD